MNLFSAVIFLCTLPGNGACVAFGDLQPPSQTLKGCEKRLVEIFDPAVDTFKQLLPGLDTTNISVEGYCGTPGDIRGQIEQDHPDLELYGVPPSSTPTPAEPASAPSAPPEPGVAV